MNLGRRIATFTVVGCLLGLTACHYSPEEKANWVESKISSRLDLNADQKSKLDALKQAVLDVQKAHQTDRARHLDEIKQMILSDHLDASKVRAMMAERQKIENDNFDSIFSKVAAFHDSLTPEQKKKAVDLVDTLSKY